MSNSLVIQCASLKARGSHLRCITVSKMYHDCFTPFPAVLQIVSARKNKKTLNVLMTESNDIQNKNDNPIEGDDEMCFFVFFIICFFSLDIAIYKL